MSIDWTKPVLCARGLVAEPLFDGQGRIKACSIGSVVYAEPSFEKLGLRNAAPKPLRREGYVVICPSYPNADHDFGKVASGPIFRDGDALASIHPKMIIGRIMWNSDGSPVEDAIDRDEPNDTPTSTKSTCNGWPECKHALHPMDPAHWLHHEEICRCGGRDNTHTTLQETINLLDEMTLERDRLRLLNGTQLTRIGMLKTEVNHLSSAGLIVELKSQVKQLQAEVEVLTGRLR